MRAGLVDSADTDALGSTGCLAAGPRGAAGLAGIGNSGLVAHPTLEQVDRACAWGLAHAKQLFEALQREGYATEGDRGTRAILGTPLSRRALVTARHPAVTLADGPASDDQLLVSWSLTMARPHAALLSDVLLREVNHGFLMVLRQGPKQLRPTQLEAKAAPWPWWARWGGRRVQVVGVFACDGLVPQMTEFCLYPPTGMGEELSVWFDLAKLS